MTKRPPKTLTARMRRHNPAQYWVVICFALSSLAALAQPSTKLIDDELRVKLSEAVSSAKSFEDEFDAQVWLLQKSKVLKRYIEDPERRLYILKQVHYEAKRANVPPEFVLAVIHIESHFDQFALSHVGARGMMQIMPFWKNEIGRPGDNLMDIDTNLRYGCTILRHYYDRAKGNWSEALARYNGSYGRTTYSEKVMVAWGKHWR